MPTRRPSPATRHAPPVTHAPIRMEAAGIEWIQAKAGDQNKVPRISIVAYTGGIMRPAGWPELAIDLEGADVAGNIPILAGHVDDLDALAGQGVAEVRAGQLFVAGPLTEVTSAGRVVIALGRDGVKLQASVGYAVETADHLSAGQTVQLNGRQITAGPLGLTIIRKGRLREVSLLPIGADPGTNVSIAAAAASASAASHNERKETSMNFDQWIQALGFDSAELRDDQKALLQAKYDSEVKAAAKAAGEITASGKTPTIEPPRFDLQAVSLAYEKHATAVQAETAKYAGKIEAAKLAEIQGKATSAALELKAAALAEEWPGLRLEAVLIKAAAMHEVELIRAERPRGPAIHSSSRDVSGPVIEAAFCRSVGLPNREKHFKPEVLEAADKLGGIGLQEVILIQANAAGYAGRQRIKRDNIREVMQHAFIRAAGFSTIDVAGILSNVANKSLLEGFNVIPQTWRGVARVAPVSDFKTHTRYRLTDSLQYEEVAPTGLIPHGELGEESYTNIAKTYAKMLTLTRTDIINDDLGAFDSLRTRLGMGAALKLNDLFWVTWLAASNAATFWTAARGNLVTTASLGLDGIAKAVKAFRDMPAPGAAVVLDAADQARKQGNLNLPPDRMLVGSSLEPTAQSYFVSELIQDTTTSTKRATGNYYRNAYTPIVAPEVENARYTGSSATTWWLCCNPAILASAEVCFLDGAEAPTVESADADFNTLGIQFRGFHDFGVAMAEYRASVKATA